MDSTRPFQLASNSNTKKENPFSEGKNENLIEDSEYDESGIKAKTDFSTGGTKTIQLKMQKQNDNHTEWFKDDLKNQRLGIFFQGNFTPKDEKPISDQIKKEPEIIELNQIATKFISNKFSFKALNSEWTPFKQDNKATSGMSMKQNMLKINKSINLRSLSCKLQIELKMQGMSLFTILMRSLGSFDNDEAYIVQYRKEGFCESSRLYVLLGKVEKNEFIFMKKCEIPLLSIPAQLTTDDILSIIVEIMDFGNDKIYIFSYMNDKMSKPFKLKYENLLIPMFEDFKIYMMGNGDETYIKSLLVEIFDRKDFFSEKENKNFCNKCKNCVIF